MNTWLYLHFPNLQLEFELNQSAQHTENTLALIIVNEKTNEVLQLSDAAKKCGIKAGMGLAAACTLSHQLIVHPFDLKLTQALLVKIATHLYSKTADISIFGESGILLNCSAMGKLYPNQAQYWHMLEQHLAELPYGYYGALGFSPYSAKWAAIAKLGLYFNSVPFKHAFLQLPLTFSDLTSKQQTQLARIGVNLYSDVVSLLNAELASRVDNQAVSYLKQVFAMDVTPVDYFHPSETFFKQLELSYEIAEQERLLKPLGKLLIQLENFLLKRSLVAKSIALTLFYREAEPLQIVLNSVQGQYKHTAWLNLIALKFNQITLIEPVIEVALALISSEPVYGQCNDLFGYQQTNLSQAELVSNLMARLGEHAVVQPVINDDPRPEKSNQLVSWQQGASLHRAAVKGIRPTYLVTPPKALAQTVSVLHGPERIISGWWDSEPCTRDYFVAQNQQGQQLWVFRDLSKQWFIHGYFG